MLNTYGRVRGARFGFFGMSAGGKAGEEEAEALALLCAVAGDTTEEPAGRDRVLRGSGLGSEGASASTMLCSARWWVGGGVRRMGESGGGGTIETVVCILIPRTTRMTREKRKRRAMTCAKTRLMIIRHDGP